MSELCCLRCALRVLLCFAARRNLQTRLTEEREKEEKKKEGASKQRGISKERGKSVASHFHSIFTHPFGQTHHFIMLHQRAVHLIICVSQLLDVYATEFTRYELYTSQFIGPS